MEHVPFRIIAAVALAGLDHIPSYKESSIPTTGFKHGRPKRSGGSKTGYHDRVANKRAENKRRRQAIKKQRSLS